MKGQDFWATNFLEIMWAPSSSSPSPSIRRFPIPTRPPPVPAIYANSPPPKSAPHDDGGNLKSLSNKILSAVKSRNPKSPNPSRNQTTPKQESETQISGSDVLRALQKAAAVKEKNKIQQVKEKKKEGSDSEMCEMSPRVRPLRIKTDWALRLAKLEKRLQEISDTVS